MRRRNRYANRDPYWLEARFSSDCAGCGRRIQKGERIFYYPNGKSAYCSDDSCGGNASREFSVASFDEDFTRGAF